MQSHASIEPQIIRHDPIPPALKNNDKNQSDDHHSRSSLLSTTTSTAEIQYRMPMMQVHSPPHNPAMSISPVGSRGRITKPVQTKKSKTKRRESVTTKSTPYTPQTYPPETTLNFPTTQDWDPSLLVAGTRKIVFGQDFDIRESVTPFPHPTQNLSY